MKQSKRIISFLLSAILISSSVNINFIHAINKEKYNTSYEMNETQDSIGNIIFDKKAYESGDDVHISIHPQQDASEISNMKVSISNPNGEIIVNNEEVKLNENGFFSYTYNLDEYALEGYWEVSSIEVEDTEGNTTTYTNAENDDWKFYVKTIDKKAPIVNRVEFDKESYVGGDDVNIKVYGDDDLSGMDSMVMTIVNSDGDFVNQMSGVPFNEEGVVECTYKLSEFAVSGYWKIESLYISDKAGNGATYYEGKDYEGEFLVEGNDDQDRQAPVINKIEFDKDSYMGGDMVNIKVYGEDNLSGLDGMIITLANSDGDFVNQTGVPFNEEGVADFTYELNKYAIAGSWKIESIYIYDKAGNGVTYYEGKDYEGEFLVEENDGQDRQAPIISKIEFDKESYISGETVKIKVYAEDDLSGIDNMAISIYNPDGKLVNSTLGVSFNDEGIAEFDYALDRYAMIGTWQVGDISIFDKAGNGKNYSNENDFNGNFEIVNEAPKIIVENQVIGRGRAFNPLQNVKAIDNEDGDITNKLKVIKNTVNVNAVGTYQVEYEVADSKKAKTKKTIKVTVENNTFTKALIINTVKATASTVTGSGEKGATVKAYVGTKEIGNATVGSNGKYAIKIKSQKSGTKITVKMSKTGYTTVSSSKTVVNDKFTKSLTINNIKATTSTVTGSGQKGATVKAYVGTKEIGKATVGSNGKYTIKIKAQKKGTKITVKMSKTGYNTVSKSITVK